MHWTVKGADTIFALRCSKLGGRIEDFWKYHRADHDFPNCVGAGGSGRDAF
jgi:hypothetical protein